MPVLRTGMINDQFSMINKVRLWRTPPAAELIENWNLKIENSTAEQWHSGERVSNTLVRTLKTGIAPRKRG